MSKAPQLSVTKRTQMGRKVKLLRRQHFIPGNIFGKTIKSEAISLNALEFKKLFDNVGETTLIDLHLGDESKSRPVLISFVQRHPVTGEYIHVDFHQVDLTQKVTANIPLEFIGESPAVKELGGILVHVISEIEVEALPAELPENFTVDLSNLKAIGDSLLLKDLKIDRTKLTIDLEETETVVTIQAPKEEEIEEVPTPAEAQVGDKEAESTEPDANESGDAKAPASPAEKKE